MSYIPRVRLSSIQMESNTGPFGDHPLFDNFNTEPVGIQIPSELCLVLKPVLNQF